MIEKLKRGRALLYSIYAMDERDEQALNEAKSIMEKASSEIVKLQGALEFYADQNNYSIGFLPSAVKLDRGRKASKALKGELE